MAKKKATMTLKDFHGGSIPSDLPLPSAPGVIVKPSDRFGFDRQAAWGNPMGRFDTRLRPGSAGGIRKFDDKTPFITHNTHIGRNFDEDERTPLDGVSAPRRTVSGESIRALSVGSEPKLDYLAPNIRPMLTPVSQFSNGTTSSYVGRSTASVNAESFCGDRVNYQHVGGNNGQTVVGSSPNAWGLKKEMAGIAEQVPAPWSAPDAAMKLAQASALDKVSSGRWHSKQPTDHQIDVEIIKHPETESNSDSKGYVTYNRNVYNHMVKPVGKEFHEAVLVRHAERSLTIDDGVWAAGNESTVCQRPKSPTVLETKESDHPHYCDWYQPLGNVGKFGASELKLAPDAESGLIVDGIRIGSKESVYERPRSPMYSVTKEKTPHYGDRLQPPGNVGKFGGSELPLAVTPESSERPKLKLLPRSRPLENVEPRVDNKQPYQQANYPGQVDHASEVHGKVNGLTPGLTESENRVLERPKLSLKPRSQSHEQSEENSEMKQKTLFGGARPRELVLQERGNADDTVNNNHQGHPPNRVQQDVIRAETLPNPATPTHYNGKAENGPLDHRIGKNVNKRDQRVDAMKSDVQRRNWRSENQKNSREYETQQQSQERPPSPETWRKPVEQPASPTGIHYGKAASPVELAQAFSRSISDPKTANRFSGQSGMPTSGQIPFSQLTVPHPRPRINGF